MSAESALAEAFTVHKHLIITPLGRPNYLIPFGDIHRYSPNNAEDRWLEWLEWAAKKPDAWFFGMGDYLDLLSGSERKAFRVADLHESTIETLEEIYDNLLEKFARELTPLRGKIVGLLEGNHQITFSDGTTSTQRLCRKLGCKYLGYTTFVRLQFRAPGKKDAAATAITIFASHGYSSGGRTVTGGMNAVERSEVIGIADVYLQGHNHQKGALPFARLDLIDDTRNSVLKVVERKGYFVRTGSFLRSYVPGMRSYSSKKCYRPTDLGTPIIEMTMHRRGPKKNLDPITVELHATV